MSWFAVATLTKSYDKTDPLVVIDHLELFIREAESEDHVRGIVVGEVLTEDRKLTGILIAPIESKEEPNVS